VGTFLALAVPGLALFGALGFIGGRVLGALAGLAVRRHYVRRLLPNVELLAVAARGLGPVLGAAGIVLALRGLLWGGDRWAGQVAAELALFGVGTVVLTWVLERELLRELMAELRTRRLEGGPGAAPEDPTAPGVGDLLAQVPAAGEDNEPQPARGTITSYVPTRSSER
jgi:hypothetical protein